jgi:hypothetical protein
MHQKPLAHARMHAAGGTLEEGQTIIIEEFSYGVYNQCELFICLDLMVKNRDIFIERYFKW